METLGLKNINMLTKERFDSVTEPAMDELYAVSSSGFGKPSSKYTDLTAGASGTRYTAPADGCFAVDSWVTGNYIYLVNHTASGLRSIGGKGSAVDVDISVIVSAKKGDVVELAYDGSWSPHTWQARPFSFIFDEGEQ